MNKQSYPFHKTLDGRFKLKVPIRVVNLETGKSIPTLAIIDTGADHCTFPSMITLNIGLSLDEKSKSQKGTRGISGEEQETYKHWVRIELLDSNRIKVIRSLDVIANTLKRNDIPPILGTEMFLDKFHLSVNYLKQIIELNW